MAYQSDEGAPKGHVEAQSRLADLVAMLDAALAALDAAGEKLAAAHVEMGRQVLIARQSASDSVPTHGGQDTTTR